MFAQEIVNALLQLGVVLAIGAVAWLIFRRPGPYAKWLGLTRPPSGWWKPSLALAAVTIALSVPAFFVGPLAGIATGENTVGGQIAAAGMSASTLGAILVMALVKTALTEEILFRGLIGPRLSAAFGFGIGNTIQALLFGVVHLVVLLSPTAAGMGILPIALVFGLPATAGWLMGYANVRFGEGTIWPGWLMHALGNVIAYLAFAL